MRHPGQAIMIAWHAALLWIGTAHARCRLAAHVPPGPAEHARRACCARVRGLPPPAASRSVPSLLSAARPARGLSTGESVLGRCAPTRMMGLSAMASLWTSVRLLGATCISNGFALTRELSCLETALAPSNADARMLREVRVVRA